MPNKYLIGIINLAADDKHSIYNLYVVEANDLLSAFAEYRNTFNLGKFEQPEMVKILPPDTPVGPYTDEKKEEPTNEEEEASVKMKCLFKYEENRE